MRAVLRPKFPGSELRAVNVYDPSLDNSAPTAGAAMFRWLIIVSLLTALPGAWPAWADDASDCAIVDDLPSAVVHSVPPSVFPACLRLANQGYAFAQYNLGLLYSTGNGVPTDFGEAAKWYRRAADQGYAPAQFELAGMYAIGLGVPQDTAEAAKWDRNAADQGYAWAQFDLARLYDKGQGVPQSFAEAKKWYLKAADQGFVVAQDFLAAKYMAGDGVPQSYSEAAKWYRKAADQGDSSAQFYLGLMYAGGEGVPKDSVQAYMWFNLSAAQEKSENGKAAKNRDAIAASMTQAQIAEAQALAAAWMPTKAPSQ